MRTGHSRARGGEERDAKGVPFGWAFVGREAELDLIDRRRAAGDRAIVVTGSPGVGKSRLAREALARFEKAGTATRWVQATRSAAGVPLGAFAGLVPELPRADDPLELLRLFVQSFSDLNSQGAVVLGVDDAHLLDSASAALLLELTVRGTAFVVMTVRAGEHCPDAVTSVWKDRGAARIELDTLDRPHTEALAEEIVGGPIEQSARAWICDTSLGNALYVCELTRGALSGGALAEVRGLWRMASRPPISASLSELITARLTGLPTSSAHAVDLLALGETVPVGELVTLVGGDTVADVEARGLLTVSAGLGSDASLAHPLFGEVVRAGLPPIRKRQLRLELAAAISRRGDPTPRDLLRATRWLVDAREELSTSALLDAAEAANLSGDPSFGADLARRALASGGSTRAALALARALVLEGGYREAGAVLATAEDDVAVSEGLGQALQYLELQTTVLYWGMRQPDALQAQLERARTWNHDPIWHRHLDRLGLIGNDDTPVHAAAASREIYDAADSDPDVRRRIAPVLAANLFYDGQVREAHRLLTHALPSVPLRDLTDEITFALWVAVTLEHGEGWTAFDAQASTVLADGIRAGDRAAAGRASLALGGLRFSQGRFLEASRWLAEAELQLEGRDTGGLLAIVHAMQVGVAAFTGNVEAIGGALERCRLASGGGTPLPSQLPYIARAEAWAVLGNGDRPRAQVLLLEAAGRIRQLPVYAARLTYEALRAGAPARRVAPQLQELAGCSDARLTGAYAMHATALASYDAEAVLAVSDEMEAIGALRYAAEAAANAASIYAAAGRRDAARRAAARCQDLQPKGGGGLPPVIDGLGPDVIALTARERQLIDLAGRGLSNTEIAELLVLSVRTVESHLYRAMGKLGVTNRRLLRARG